MKPLALAIALLALAPMPASASPPPPGWSERREHGVHFVFRQRHASFVRELSTATPAITARLRKDLGLARLDEPVVYVAQNPTELAAISPRDPAPPKGALGVAYPARGLVVLALSAGAQPLPMSLEALYAHELAHMALDQAVGHRRVPRWFSEGFSIRQSGELSWGRLEALWGATIAHRLIPLAQLEQRFSTEHEVSLAYAEAGDFVAFLSEEDRPGAIADLCARVRRGVPFRAALESNYASRLRELERQFFARLEERFSVIPALTGLGAVWGIGGVLLLVAYRRKRRTARATLARWEIEERAADLAQGAADGLPPLDQDPPGEALAADEGPRPRRVYHDGDFHTLH